ncbi:LCP family protein [Patescibacteria group bacterium]
MKSNKLIKILIFLFILSFLFFLSSLIYYYLNPVKDEQQALVSETNPTLEIDLKDIPAPQESYNILLLGHGDPGHPGGDLADTLIVVHLDTKEKKVAMVSIPRDTWLSVKISESQVEPHKINEVYLVGKKAKGEEFGFSLIKQAVGEVTNLPIHYFVFINFSKFMEVIDGLGGVEVDVPVAFDDYYYPVRGRELEICDWLPEDVAAMTATMSGFLLEKQFTCRYEHLHFEKEKTQMNGETALKFVRSRHSNQHGGDFARAERQQALLQGVADKLLSLNALKKAPAIFDQFDQMVTTDLDLEIIEAIVKTIVDPQEYSIDKVVLSTDNVFDSSRNSTGQFILAPKAGLDQWGGVHEVISQAIKKEEVE